MVIRNHKKRGCIVILSREIDNSVDKVIEWLYYFGCNDIIRIRPEKRIKIDTITIKDDEAHIFIEIDKKKLNFSNTRSFWVRNGYFSHNYFFESESSSLQNKVNKFLNAEWKYLNNYLIFQLTYNKKHIGNFKELAPNKLTQLFYAKKVGLKIPETDIITKYDPSMNKGRDIISKPVKDIFTLEKDLTGLASKTKVVSDIENQTGFFPSLIQTKIDKFFELRVYFFGNKYYPAAIFTGEGSEPDYRSEGNKGNLRIVPYSIPKSIKYKLKRLMKVLQVESGSIDLIVSKKLEYYYLEVNPVGYFDNISAICNYNIEKNIARYLAC